LGGLNPELVQTLTVLQELRREFACDLGVCRCQRFGQLTFYSFENFEAPIQHLIAMGIVGQRNASPQLLVLRRRYGLQSRCHSQDALRVLERRCGHLPIRSVFGHQEVHLHVRKAVELA
jgi:hypothetical protein